MELHLFSAPEAEEDLRFLLDACRPLLRDHSTDSIVAYLPLGSLVTSRRLEQTRKLFRNVGVIELIDTETMDLPEMEAVFRRAVLAYIPDGNVYLLNHRLHLSRLIPYLQKKILNGLPVIAVGAGAVACGPNILTADDLNLVPTPHFAGLAVTPFNLHVHYVDDVQRDEWLAPYHTFHDNAVILLEDGAHLKLQGKSTTLVHGAGWCLRAGREKQRLAIGEPISIH
jgi:peptidase E